VCLTRRLRAWYIECAVEHGLAGRLASVRALDVPLADVARAKDKLADRVVALSLRTVEEDDAEVVIVGGGPMAGLARQVASRIPVPTLDGVTCAVRLAESLAGLGPRAPERGSFARPPAKATRGLTPALAAMLERRARPDA
jgi:allantoin racemase